MEYRVSIYKNGVWYPLIKKYNELTTGWYLQPKNSIIFYYDKNYNYYYGWVNNKWCNEISKDVSLNITEINKVNNSTINSLFISEAKEMGYKDDVNILLSNETNQTTICNSDNFRGYNFINNTFYFGIDNDKLIPICFNGQWQKIVENYKILKFGDVKFKIESNSDIAVTEYGDVTKKQIKDAINYINRPPKLCGYELTIHFKNSYNVIENIANNNNEDINIGFGCMKGTLQELIKILKAFDV